MKLIPRTTVAMGMFLAVALFAIGVTVMGIPTTEEVNEISVGVDIIKATEYIPTIGVWQGISIVTRELEPPINEDPAPHPRTFDGLLPTSLY